MTSESHNTTFGEVKQELHVFKTGFTSELPELSNRINKKIDNIYKLLDEFKGNKSQILKL